MESKVTCTLEILELSNCRDSKEIDCCFVNRQIIYENDFGLANPYYKATAIGFDECIMFAFPSSYAIKWCMPNLTVLNIINSKLSKITSKDLEGYDFLKDLYVTSCEIEYLPGDLFEHTPQLEVVSFYDNKIKYIDEGILDPLQNLKVFDLSLNVNIDAHYNILNHKVTNVTLEQLKNEIKTKCSRTDLKEVCEKQQAEITDLKRKDEARVKEMADVKGKYEDLKKKLGTVLQQVQAIKQDSKNFTIKVHEKQFRVNKAVLIAHSEVLAKLIADNPEADDLELKDISEATFEEILNFMNDGSAPAEDADFVELFGASFRLKIEALTTIVAELLKEKVNPANAFNVLVLCEKFDNLKRYDELKEKALAEYSKLFRPN